MGQLSLNHSNNGSPDIAIAIESDSVTPSALTSNNTNPGSSGEPAASAASAASPTSDFLRPKSLTDEAVFVWDENELPQVNFELLGKRLASTGDLFRQPGYACGLLLASNQLNVPPVRINNGKRLAAVIVDRVRVRVVKEGKCVGSKIASGHLNIMLESEIFLQQFRPVDAVLKLAQFSTDFELTEPGYNDDGPGKRALYIGGPPVIGQGLDTINKFLGVMAFNSDADRSNAVAAAITVLLRNHWPGNKPVILVTASKSQAGKDTIVLFASGNTRQASISYQAADWALEQSFVAAVKHDPATGVVVIDNAKLVKRQREISSAYLERFLTDPEPILYSTGTGAPVRRRNDLVVAMSTNFGLVSQDLMNRALPIHLNPVGTLADRVSPVGNPKFEFLPRNRDRIEAELRGMIESWKDQGRPLDQHAKHVFSDWAKTVGGVLIANGFKDFLANYSLRRTVDDPVRSGLALIGAARTDTWMQARDWAQVAVEVGVVKDVVPEHDRDSDEGRARGIGVVLSTHRDEAFEVETVDNYLKLRLKKARLRFDSGVPTTRYKFEVLAKTLIPEDVVDVESQVSSESVPAT